MLQQLVADAKEMEAESSAAERSAQTDYEAFGKAPGAVGRVGRVGRGEGGSSFELSYFSVPFWGVFTTFHLTLQAKTGCSLRYLSLWPGAK